MGPGVPCRRRAAGPRLDGSSSTNACSRSVPERVHLPESRLQSLYDSQGFGGDRTMRAKVIRELIDEIRALRVEVA